MTLTVTPAAVLIVDDSTPKRKAIEAILAPLRVDIVHAASGREALRHLLNRDFALLLLDIHMRDLDGFETAALIRKRPRNRNTPIIFVTAYDQTETDLARGYSLGAVDFIHAPLHPDVLRAKASVFVDLYYKQAEIRLLYAEAQEASRVKSEFLNMAAHELRTPLSVVRGYVSMLVDGSLGDVPDTCHRALEILENKTGELNDIVDSLLLTARIDEGRLPSETQAVDLVDAVREAVQRAEARRALLDAELHCIVPDGPALATADPAHVARILDNLINNALTYCATVPRVRIAVAAAGIPRVTVEDNGIGIPESRQAAIFDRFVRVEDRLLGPTQGTGLGLYISRELALLAGGSLGLDWSRPGQGSQFTLALPPAETGTEAESRAPAPREAVPRT